MSVEVTGEGGSGEVITYALPDSLTALLESISFRVDTSVTGAGHMVRLRFVSPTGETLGRLDDLNVGADGQQNFYTYALGLNGSACTLPAGIAVTDALPWTELLPGTEIRLEPIDELGVTLADTISHVLMHFDRAAAPAPDPGPLLPLVLLPGSA